MGHKKLKEVIRQKALAAICVSILCTILIAGLWPFTPYPKNEVSWLEHENGLRFGHYGSILSAGAFKMTSSQDVATCSLEFWSQPGLIDDANTILAFYSPENLVSFSLHQSIDDLVLRREIPDQQHRSRAVEFYIDHVFRSNKTSLITITSGPNGTVVYVDGAFVRVSPNFGLSGKDFIGQLVVANSPVANDSWSGMLRGLAIYNRELLAGQVLQHFVAWTERGRPEVADNEGAVALYVFDERAGTLIHNKIASGSDLYIPDHYLVLHEVFLEQPWKEFSLTRSYLKNVIINIGGFIPLGFSFCAYFSSVRHYKRAPIVTILFGATISLTIEILQAYIPTRDSGMTDVITNTFGTTIGANLYGRKIAQVLLSRFGIPINR
jgi:VanZ like protein/concanavalin A-like lectin/glucanase superfamily protein